MFRNAFAKILSRKNQNQDENVSVKWRASYLEKAAKAHCKLETNVGETTLQEGLDSTDCGRPVMTKTDIFKLDQDENFGVTLRANYLDKAVKEYLKLDTDFGETTFQEGIDSTDCGRPVMTKTDIFNQDQDENVRVKWRASYLDKAAKAHCKLQTNFGKTTFQEGFDSTDCGRPVKTKTEIFKQDQDENVCVKLTNFLDKTAKMSNKLETNFGETTLLEGLDSTDFGRPVMNKTDIFNQHQYENLSVEWKALYWMDKADKAYNKLKMEIEKTILQEGLDSTDWGRPVMTKTEIFDQDENGNLCVKLMEPNFLDKAIKVPYKPETNVGETTLQEALESTECGMSDATPPNISKDVTVYPRICYVPCTGGQNVHTLVNNGPYKLVFHLTSTNKKRYGYSVTHGFIKPYGIAEINVIRCKGRARKSRLFVCFGIAPEGVNNVKQAFAETKHLEFVDVLLVAF